MYFEFSIILLSRARSHINLIEIEKPRVKKIVFALTKDTYVFFIEEMRPHLLYAHPTPITHVFFFVKTGDRVKLVERYIAAAHTCFVKRFIFKSLLNG